MDERWRMCGFGCIVDFEAGRGLVCLLGCVTVGFLGGGT